MNSRTLLIISLVGIVFFSSCSESKLEDKLIGNWKQISVGQLGKQDITWTFTANRELYQVIILDTILVRTDTAQWSVEANAFSKNTMTIENLNQESDGKYEIHQLDNYLELSRVELSNGHGDGSFLWKEFEKK